MKLFPYLFLIFLLLYSGSNVIAQDVAGFDRIESIRTRLDNLADDVPQLKNKVSFSVSDVSLYEFLRALAVNNKLNLNVDPSLNTHVAINFTQVSIMDLLAYMCDQYGLEILTTGNIISVVKNPEPPLEIAPVISKDPVVSYNDSARLVSYDLKDDTLNLVLKKIAAPGGVNIITAQKNLQRLVSGYVKNMPVAEAVRELAYVNGLSFREKDSITYYMEDAASRPAEAEGTNAATVSGLKLLTNKKDSIISISAGNVAIKDVLAAAAQQMGINYFVFSEIKGTTNVKAEHIDFDLFLKYLFNATDYSARYSNGIYLIGDRKQEEIRTAEIYPMQYRTVNKLPDQIPTDLKKNLEIIPVADLNSLVIAGAPPAIKDLKDFLRLVDKIVPVVNIELVIMDIRNSHAISTGIMAGIDNTKSTSTYTSVFPNIDVTLGTNTINNIIDGINGTGLVNLGKVAPNFYISLKASEDNGYLKIRSTPRLATLNGSEAEMTIGETRYYAEKTSNVITTQSTTTVNATVFKELQANFKILIKPIVSGDEQITLDISVEQSTFTEQFTKDGPYGRLTRSFKSSLRVKNNDMVLLGGLEERNKNDAGQGVPVLSHIPILKWLFSSRSSTNKKNKLVILIHPTVFY